MSIQGKTPPKDGTRGGVFRCGFYDNYSRAIAAVKTMSYYIIIRGPLGSGKTTTSKKLAQAINAEYIGIDDILDEHNLTEDKEDGYISQRSFIKANGIGARRVEHFLENATPVIFDGNFYWKSQTEDLLQRLSYPNHVFTLMLPLERCIERDSKRAKPCGRDATEAVFVKTTEFEYGILIDASRSPNQVVNDIFKFLGNM